MAHMVFKKPLQNQGTRDDYTKKRRELRTAKELGFIDVETYENAKKSLLPEMASPDRPPNEPPSITVDEATLQLSDSALPSGSSTTAPSHNQTSLSPGKRRGTILDRNDVARLAYKFDAQSDVDRKELRLQRKAQKALSDTGRFTGLDDYQYQLNEADEDEIHNPSRFDHLIVLQDSLPVPTRTLTPATSDSNSSTSVRSGKSQRMGFNIFRKRSASTSRHSPPPLPPNVSPLISQGMPPGRRERRPGSIDTKKSSISRRHTESRGGGREAILDAIPMTLADVFLMGPPPNSRSRNSSRRHSFSSQNSRQSLASSQQSNEAPMDLIIRKAREEFLFESRPSSPDAPQLHLCGPPEASQSQTPPLSTVLQDMFLSLLNDFSDTSILFSYPKYGKIQWISYSSSLRSIPRSLGSGGEVGEGGAEKFGMEGEGSPLLGGGAIVRKIIEKNTWFLMAMKWLSFGRVLFSPGHHLIELSGSVGIGVAITRPSILDLDGSVTAGFSWHLAEEYPFAKIYNILLPHSPRPARNSAAPSNLHAITAPSLNNLSALPSNSIDVIVSHNLPRLLFQNKGKSTEELIQLLKSIFRECARVLRPSGYFEMTVVDPVMNNMGPRTRDWVTKYISQVNSMRPSKMVLVALEQISGQGEEVLFDEVKDCWVWMPTTSIGDELSTMTSMVGRHLYDHLYALDEGSDNEQGADIAYGVYEKKECKMWKDEEVIEECQKENTAFRWLKCYARKV